MPSDEDGHPRGDGDPEWDYGVPNSGGDSHEDEFDEEYGEQQPKGDPNAPDNTAWERQYGGAIDEQEEINRQIAEEEAERNFRDRQNDPDRTRIDDPALNPDAASPSDAATFVRFAGAPEDSSLVSQSSQLDPDDFDYAESVDPVGPPTPDPAIPFAEAFGESASLSSQLGSSDRFDPDESHQAAIVDPGPSLLDSAAGEADAVSGRSLDPAGPFADAFGDGSVSPPYQLGSPDRFDPDDSYQGAIVDPGPPTFDSAVGEPDAAGSLAFDPAAQSHSDMSEQTDWNDFIG